MPSTPPPPDGIYKHALAHSAVGSGSTPIKPGSVHDNPTKLPAEETYREMSEELAGCWVGPMPVEEFTEEFFPLSDRETDKPQFNKNHFDSMQKFRRETDMYDPMAQYITNSGSIPGYQIVNTSTKADKGSHRKNRPDLMIYKDNINIGTDPTRYDEAEIAFEIKPFGKTCDPFQDPTISKGKEDEDDQEAEEDNSETNNPQPPTIFEGKSEARTLCRGQIAYYASMILARQHRTHCFAVWIGDPWARLIRIDRDGGTVTARFNYRERGDLLLDFLWRYSTASESSKGKDPSVRRATSTESDLAREKLFRWKPQEDKFRPVYMMTIKDRTFIDEKDEDAPLAELVRRRKTMDVLVWTSFAEPTSVRGRATRVYPGYDPDSGQIVLVKDAWRPVVPDIQKETETLQTLKDNSVRNVPILLCGDDINDQWQQTVTHAYTDKSWNVGGVSSTFQERQHIRFATDKVGTPLVTFPSSKVLVTAIRDALIGHKDAFEKCGILHRDISTGNILIYLDEKGGFLNDWDLARRVDDMENGPRQQKRSGTWAYMAAYLLAMPKKMQTLQDDLESIFWVLLYIIMRYMGYNIKIQDRRETINRIFYQRATEDGQLSGGDGKIAFITKSNRPKLPNNKALNDLVFDFHEIIHEFHNFMSILNRKVVQICYDDENITVEDAIRTASLALDNKFKTLDICNYNRIQEIFEEALKSNTWPENDKGCDYFPETTHTKRKLVEDEGTRTEGSNSKKSKT